MEAGVGRREKSTLSADVCVLAVRFVRLLCGGEHAHLEVHTREDKGRDEAAMSDQLFFDETI